MGNAIVTMRIMPENPDIELKPVEELALEKIKAFGAKGQMKTDVKPIAFGLKAIDIMFMMDEAKGSTDSLEEDLKTIEGVQSVEVVDMRRALG
ncbi:MAG: elongation factor 1-beta [Candidatus Woesearchaeota archaeon]